MTHDFDKVLIWDQSGHPNTSWKQGKTVFYWQRHSADSHLNVIPILSVIEDNADDYRERYLSWIYDVGRSSFKGAQVIEQLQLRPGLSAWWMSPIAEKCNFDKSPHINDVIKLMALLDCLAGHIPKEIHLVSCNANLAKVLREWCRDQECKFLWKKNDLLEGICCSNNYAKSFLSKVPHTIQALIYLLYRIYSGFLLSGVGVRGWRNSKGRLTFVSYLSGLNDDRKSIAITNTRYWGALPDAVKKSGQFTNWIHMHSPSANIFQSYNDANKIKTLNRNSMGMEIHLTPEGFLTPLLIVAVICDWVLLIRRCFLFRMECCLPPLDGLNLWPIFSYEWKSSIFGKDAIKNILNFHLFEKVLGVLPRQKLGIFLQENMAWEQAFLYGWRKSGHKKIIGYPHSTIRFWDLRYFEDVREYHDESKAKLMPDYFAVNGPMAMRALARSGFVKDKLVEVEALRYMHLAPENFIQKSGISDLRKQKNATLLKSTLRLLVLGDYNENHVRMQIKMLYGCLNLLSVLPSITIKFHPACSVDLINNMNFISSKKQISDLLLDADVVFAGPATSAALDAYCMGAQVIVALDPSALNLSPLRGFKHMKYVSSSQELANAINDSISAINNQGYNLEKVFNLDLDMRRWIQILRNI